MKCENCPALRTGGGEYPESYCAAGVPEDSKMCTDGGCRYPLKAIRQRIERRAKMEAHQYDGVTVWFEKSTKREKAMTDALNEAISSFGIFLCYPFRGEYHLLAGDGRATIEIANHVLMKFNQKEEEIQKTFCDRCRWRDRYQKCTACRRNLMRRDLFEEKKEVQE